MKIKIKPLTWKKVRYEDIKGIRTNEYVYIEESKYFYEVYPDGGGYTPYFCMSSYKEPLSSDMNLDLEQAQSVCQNDFERLVKGIIKEYERLKKYKCLCTK